MHYSNERPVRNKTNSEIIFGIRPVIEAIKAGKEIEKLLISKELKSGNILELMDEVIKMKLPVSKVPVEKLDRITKKNHQGVICYISAISYASLDNIITNTYQSGGVPLILILDRITDVRNFGAIARTSECAGVHAIVIPSKGNAMIGSDAIKTSAGALNFVPICREANLKNTINYLKDSGLQIVACTEKALKEIYTGDFTGPTAIIMGSEEDGVSPEYLRKADIALRIPVQGNIGSLNVSVASGLIIYEALRQRSL